ncbi:hypothetical protein CR513_31645, partial [Mucuna pruriens]
MREEELGLLIKLLREAANDEVVVDISAKVATLSADMACRMILGKKYTDKDLDEKGFKAVMHELMHLAATPNIGDYFPYIGKLDLQGLIKRMKAMRKTFDDFFDKIIDEHIQSENGEDKVKDFVDAMLGFGCSQESEYRIELPNIKAIMLDMLVGAIDTSATVIEWTVSELLRNPKVMKKVQMELESVVGMKRKVEESDLEKLEYLGMVIKESMRLHPVAPLLIPHQSTEDCMVGDFFIPKKSKVIVNAWAVMRDPSAWDEAEKFWPERFEGSNIDLRGRDFQLIPFGSGRRACPGLQLGLTEVRLVVAQLVHCFDWKLPNNMLPSDLDMTEDFGLAMPRANHLLAIPTYRLHHQLFVVSLAYLCLWRNKKKGRKLPPGPKGLPILGSLHMLGPNVHRDLHQLAQTYGPVMHLRLGFVPVIVVSSPQAAEMFLKTHDLVFASRPPHEAAKYIAWDQRNLAFGQYGSYWRNMRKMCTLELLSQTKINSFKSMREEELDLLIKQLRETANDGVVVDISAKIATLSADMACRMILGKKYMDQDLSGKGFKAVMHELMHLAATPNIGDYFPYIGKLDLQGLIKRMKAMRKIFDDFFDKIIDEHIQSKKGEDRVKDFVDIMLGFVGTDEFEFRIERPNIKAILLDMLAGSMDTSATAIEWTVSELLRNPRVMKKVQMELEKVVGMKRKVEESDLDKLEYLDMVIKESMRIHSVAPLLIPHESREDCIVGDYFIPKKSRVIINAWAIMRDPGEWDEANKFWPERFEGSSKDVRGRDFELIPFGSGRRGCPGIQLGLTIVRHTVAQLVHCFDWKLPNDMLPEHLDMTEEFGLTMPRANHLLAIPTTYRLHHQSG